MKNVFRICFTIFLMLQAVFVLGQFTPEWDSINATTTPPTIDGVIDAVWDDADSVPITNLYSGTIVDSSDFSSYFKAMYDDTALFIMVYVEDDTLMNQEANAWSNDNVEIFLNVKQKFDLTAKDGPRYDTEKMQYRVQYLLTDSTGANSDWTDVLFASADSGSGGKAYIVEIAFPFSTILIDTTPGHATWIGLDFMVTDKDSTTNAILTWSNPGDITSSWNDMDQAGVLIFSEGDTLIADTTVLFDAIADATALLDDPNKPQEAKDSLQQHIDMAQGILDADTSTQVEIISAMLDLGPPMVWYNQQVMKVEGQFSDVEFLGLAGNYTPADPWLWEVFADTNQFGDEEMVYGITQDKPAGGNRTSILNDKTYGDKGDFFVKADMKLQKRPSGVADQGWWEDGILFFAWQDENNYAKATFFNTPGHGADPPWGVNDGIGLSGFNFVVDGQGYGWKHRDAEADPVEEIPAERCIPFESDTSFWDWNEVMVTLEDSVLSMLVNGEVYHAIGLDTVSLIEYYTGNTLDTIDTIPAVVMDLIFTPGQIGLGSGNDRVYFDNIEAGYNPTVGKFSNIDVYGDASNYTEAEGWLWDVFDDDGEMVYGITQDKPKGGNRTSIVEDAAVGGHDFFLEADMKLQKRPSAVDETSWWEDGRLFFAWQDEDNYARAQFFNTHGPLKDNPIGQKDAIGLSGFYFMVDGEGYGFMHSDDPGDPVEEIDPETCIPFVGDTSFYDWNKVAVMLEDSVLKMLVNGEVYHAVGLDTVVFIEFYSGNKLDTIDSIPAAVIDLLYTAGGVGIGSSNDRVYFDNVNAGWVEVSGIFNDDEPDLGDAANYKENSPWLWEVFDEGGGEMVYGLTKDKRTKGDRKSIYQGMELDNDYWISMDMKLVKRYDGVEGSTKFEDGAIFFSYQDEDNYAQAMFFIHHAPGVTGDPVGQGDAFGISGFKVKYEGQEYRLTKMDDPGDPIEEIPPESCIPYEDDSSFDAWYWTQFEREGTIIRMLVDGEEYFAIDIDTLTMGQIYGGPGVASWQFSHWAEIPQGAKDMMLGKGQWGIGSANDQVYFDWIYTGYIGVEGVFSDNGDLGDAGFYEETNPWLWDVFDDGGETVYGIIEDKPAGGNRTSIYYEEVFGDGEDFYVSADMKLQKRPSAPADNSWWEDARLFFCWDDDENFARAEFFNTHGPFVGSGNDAFGLAGFVFVVDGVTYKLKKGDDPGDPTEEIPPERCIPYEDDNSFNNWNEIMVKRVGTILSMVVNGETYWEFDIDTLTKVQVGADLVDIPAGLADMLKGGGFIGIGSSNDRVYFDNVDAGIATGVDELTESDLAGSVMIYPNPASEQFTIAEIEQVNKIEIYNLAGQKVMETLTHGQSTITISTSRFDSGIYFVRTVMDTGEVTINKLIIR